MNQSDFVRLISLYRDAHVSFSYDRVKNTLQLITISFEDECGENYCEIIADWHTRSTTILRSSALEPDELLQVSYVMKLLVNFLYKGVVDDGSKEME